MTHSTFIFDLPLFSGTSQLIINLLYTFCSSSHEKKHFLAGYVAIYWTPCTIQSVIIARMGTVYICTHVNCSIYVYIYKYTRRLPHHLTYHSPLSCPERHIDLSRYHNLYLCLEDYYYMMHTLAYIKVYLMKLLLCTIVLNSKLKRIYGSLYCARIDVFFLFFFFVQICSKNKCNLSPSRCLSARARAHVCLYI